MAVAKYQGPERRDYMRLGADCAVDYVKLSGDLKPVRDIADNSYSKDISASGIKIVTSEKITVGSFLELHIKIPSVNRFLTAIGKVMRCEMEGKKNFRIAISFVWINKRDRELMDEYVKSKRLEKLRSEIKE